MSDQLSRYVIYTSGLKGLDNTPDWGIKWHSSDINKQNYDAILEKFVSRLVRESTEIPELGKIDIDCEGLIYILPHQDHLQRTSYFVTLFTDIQCSSGDAEQHKKILKELAAFQLKQKMEQLSFDDKLSLTNKHLKPYKAIAPEKKEKQTNPHKPRAKKSSPQLFIALSAILLLILSYIYYSRPTVKVDELSCACYEQWWTTFHAQKQALFEQWKKNQEITLQQCNQVCEWTGAQTEIGNLLSEMTTDKHWQLQHSLMQNKGCPNPNLYQSLNQCSNGQFSKFFADLEICRSVQCN